MGVVFASAGGYHHQIGLNTWQGENAPRPLSDPLGLGKYSVVLPNHAELDSALERLDRAGIAMEKNMKVILSATH